MSHFRDRTILNPGNLPQLPSGKVTFNIGAFRIGVPLLPMDAAVVAQSGVPSVVVAAINTYSITPPTLSMDSAVPSVSKTATSP